MPLESAVEPRSDGRLSWMAAARMGDLTLLELYFSEGLQVRKTTPAHLSWEIAYTRAAAALAARASAREKTHV